MSLEEQLTQLQRDVRRWRVVGVVAFAMLAVGLVIVAGSVRDDGRERKAPLVPADLVVKTLRAEQVTAGAFSLVGPDDEPRGNLAYFHRTDGSPGSAGLQLGTVKEGQLVLEVSRDRGVRIDFAGPGGATAMHLAVDKDGLPELGLGTSAPNPVTLAVGPGGEGFMLLRDRAGRTKVVGPEK
jgi:hypothetical protein